MPKRKLEKVIESQILWIIGFLFVVMVAFLVAGYVFKQVNQFDYQGLKFEKEKFGQIPIYHYSFYGKNYIGELYKYNLYLRTDPRENNVSIKGNKIFFDSGSVYITINTDYFDECEDNALAVGDLTLFLKDNGFNVLGANMDYTEAVMNGQRYATCETEKGVFVIELFRGEETGIQISEKCAQISVGPQCNILEATERFKTQVLIDAREREINRKGGISLSYG